MHYICVYFNIKNSGISVTRLSSSDNLNHLSRDITVHIISKIVVKMYQMIVYCGELEYRVMF